MRKIITVLFVVFIILLPPRTASALDDISRIDTLSWRYSPKQAKILARRFATEMRGSGAFGEWKEADVGPTTVLYDKNGAITGYAFTIGRGNRDLGYLIISSQVRSNPVIEFSANRSPYKENSLKEIKADKVKDRIDVDVAKPLYLGPFGYYLEARKDPSGKKLILDLRAAGGSRADKNLGAAQSAPAIAAMGAEYKVIDGVTDYDQYYYDYTNSEYSTATVPQAAPGYDVPPYIDSDYYASGCAPTAAGNIVSYWAANGFSNLETGALPDLSPEWDPHTGAKQAYHKIINDLHIYMHTKDDSPGSAGGGGSTYTSKIGPGLVNYAQEIGGYDFGYTHSSSYEFSDLTAEIDAGRPAELCFINLSMTGPTIDVDWSGHAVTGVGYDFTPGDDSSRFMIVRDNWPSTPADIYVQYGGSGAYATYSSSYLVTFTPPETDTIAPTVSLDTPYISTKVSRMKDFMVNWSGNDSGSGIQYYTLRYRPDYSSKWRYPLSREDKTSYLFKGTPGRTYYFQVAAYDYADNRTWSSVKSTIVPYDQDNENVFKKAGFNSFSMTSPLSYYLSTIRSSYNTGHYVAYKMPNAKAIGLITTKAKNRGKARIYIDGRYVKTVDAHSSTTKTRQLIFYHTFTYQGTHYIKIVNAGTPGRKRFDIDGIAVRR